MSRPTLIRLLDTGAFRYRRTHGDRGHCRIRRREALAYRHADLERRRRARDELAADAPCSSRRLVFTPSFMGSEPCHVHDGPLTGIAVFDAETHGGLELLRALDDTQRAAALLRSSIAPADLPPELNHPVDGRMQAGAFKDNAVIASEGVRGGEMNAMERLRLRYLVATYVGWVNDGHAAVTMRDVDAHLDDTHFCWMARRATRARSIAACKAPWC